MEREANPSRWGGSLGFGGHMGTVSDTPCFLGPRVQPPPAQISKDRHFLELIQRGEETPLNPRARGSGTEGRHPATWEKIEAISGSAWLGLLTAPEPLENQSLAANESRGHAPLERVGARGIGPRHCLPVSRGNLTSHGCRESARLGSRAPQITAWGSWGGGLVTHRPFPHKWPFVPA